MKIAIIAIAIIVGFQDAPKKRGYLGAQVSEMKPALVIDRVVPGSPAEKAGLKQGDLIVKVDDVAVTTVAAFVKIMQERGPNAVVVLKISLLETEVKVTLAPHPQDLLEEADPALGKVRKILDLPYSAGKDAHERHKVNLVVPETDKPFPVVMWIHAGAWSFGDRANEMALGVRFAERGIGFAAISHRLTGGGWMDPKLPKEGVVHPAHIEDCARAFAWLKENIKARGGDPDRIFVSGHSSGGHLAALLAVDETYLKAHGLAVTAVKGSIPIGGAYDLPKYHAYLVGGIGKEQADAHCLAVFGPESGWAGASPSTHARTAKVPMLVITEDVPAFRKYKGDFVAAVPAESPIKFWDAADRVHENITAMMARKEPDAPRDRMIEFIKSQK